MMQQQDLFSCQQSYTLFLYLQDYMIQRGNLYVSIKLLSEASTRSTSVRVQKSCDLVINCLAHVGSVLMEACGFLAWLIGIIIYLFLINVFYPFLNKLEVHIDKGMRSVYQLRVFSLKYEVLYCLCITTSLSTCNSKRFGFIQFISLTFFLFNATSVPDVMMNQTGDSYKSDYLHIHWGVFAFYIYMINQQCICICIVIYNVYGPFVQYVMKQLKYSSEIL